MIYCVPAAKAAVSSADVAGGGQCWTSAAGCPMCAEEPALPSLLLVHLAEPAKETDTDERALSQSCGGSALKLSAFAVQRHDAGLRAT